MSLVLAMMSALSLVSACTAATEPSSVSVVSSGPSTTPAPYPSAPSDGTFVYLKDFVSPDRTVHCRVTESDSKRDERPTSLRCEVVNFSYQPPAWESRCEKSEHTGGENYGAVVVLNRQSGAGFPCYIGGTIGTGISSPTLNEGTTVVLNEFHCIGLAVGITCMMGTHSMELSQNSYRFW